MYDIQLRMAIANLAKTEEWARQLDAEIERMNRDGWKYTAVDPYEGAHDIVVPPLGQTQA